MAKLNLDWKELPSTSVTTGANADSKGIDFSTPLALVDGRYVEKGKPFVVYLTSSDSKAVRMQEVVNGTTLMDERITVGAKAFTMIKSDGDQLTKDHPFHRYLAGESLPRFVVFSGSGERVGKLEGQVSPSKLFGVMKKAYLADYIGDLDKTVKDYQKVLTQLDTLNSLKMAVEDKANRATTARDKAEVEKKRAEIAKEEEKLRIAEEKVLDLKRRAA